MSTAATPVMPATSGLDPIPTLAAGLRGTWGQVAQFGVTGAMILLLLFGGGAVFYLVRDERRAAQEDRAAERQIEREERRFERDQAAANERAMRELLGRVVQTLDRLDRSQTEHAARLADLARIVERIERRIPEKPIAEPDPDPPSSPGCSRVLSTWLLHAIVCLAPPITTSDPSRTIEFTRPPPAKAEPVPDVIRIPVGRFVFCYPTEKIPVAFDIDEPERIVSIVLPPGTPFGGIKFDEPAGAFPKIYAAPEQAQGDLCVLLAAKPGRVRVSVWGNRGEGRKPELVARQSIEVINPAAPPPEDPRPTPGPNPLAISFQSVYGTIAESDKAANLAALIQAMEAAIAICQQPGMVTAADLEAAVSTKAKAQVGRGKLQPLSRAIGVHLSGFLPTEPTTALTPELRDRAAQGYRDVAAALREVKP